MQQGRLDQWSLKFCLNSDFLLIAIAEAVPEHFFLKTYRARNLITASRLNWEKEPAILIGDSSNLQNS